MTIKQKANNKLCRICFKYIDSEKQKFVYVKSKIKRENFYHLECVNREINERKKENGNCSK